jgi:hypothetical protein
MNGASFRMLTKYFIAVVCFWEKFIFISLSFYDNKIISNEKFLLIFKITSVKFVFDVSYEGKGTKGRDQKIKRWN